MPIASSRSRTLPLALGALGVVYGDIGTSPLYAIKECFHGLHAIELTPSNVLGVLSLVFWTLTFVVGFKYLGFVLRADNRGEGGTFALLALLPRKAGGHSGLVVLAALIGTTLLYGDGMITPAISVLSAVEGLELAFHGAEYVMVPLTLLILLGLFGIQRRGTANLGRLFGPVMLLWFVVIATLGARQIVRAPQVLAAVDPRLAVDFFLRNRLHGGLALGSVVLCITGVEALYADLGHFGRAPIRLAWWVLVFPALLLNYFGQGALLLERPEAAVNPFYGLVPRALLLPAVLLASVVAVIASQAMITGVYSITRQAVQLGYLPRLHIVHTSYETGGRIYVPAVNRILAVSCIALVLTFRHSSNLAAAYGVAVTASMTITSLLFFAVLLRTWRWPLTRALPLVALFLFFDLTYLSSNLLKVFEGGWFSLGVAAASLTLMLTWHDGRQYLAEFMSTRMLPLDSFLQSLREHAPTRVPGTAVFMTSRSHGVPSALLHHFKHNKILHETVVLLSIQVEDHPRVAPDLRVTLTPIEHGVHRVIGHYGFMETPDVQVVLAQARRQGLPGAAGDSSYFLGRETLLTTGDAKMARWRKKLFSVMVQNAVPPTSWFGLPPGRVVELGMQIEL